jgi:hypothetical protein
MLPRLGRPEAIARDHPDPGSTGIQAGRFRSDEFGYW